MEIKTNKYQTAITEELLSQYPEEVRDITKYMSFQVLQIDHMPRTVHMTRQVK